MNSNFKKHNAIHLLLLLLLVYVVMLYVTKDRLLLADNTFLLT